MNTTLKNRQVLGILAFGLVSFLSIFPLHAQISPDASKVFDATLEVYKTANSFACEGDFSSQTDGTPPMKDRRTVKILFSRPDRFRLDWTEIQAGGEVITNSIFTREKTLFFYWASFDQYAKQESIESSIGANAGISRALSYMIPSLLLGQPGYFNFASLKKDADLELDGKKCFRLVGVTSNKDSYELLIDQSSHAIVQVKERQIIRSSVIEDARKELEKTNPELAKQLPTLPPQPDRNVETLITYKNIHFNSELKDGDFVFDVPKSAKRVEHIPEEER